MKKFKTRIFAKEVLQAALWDDFEGIETIKDDIVDNTRWSIVHEWIFKFGDKFYSAGYSVGATESQDESPFEYDDDEIECVEVQAVERVVTVYEGIEE